MAEPLDEPFNLKQIFTPEEAEDILQFLQGKSFEYHKAYKSRGRTVKVPRGQASYTLDEHMHYNYGVSGGSPVNEVMDERLREITEKVNTALSTNYNTILMNVYKNGEDCIAFHHDKETDWTPNTGFATLAFGATRKFHLKHKNREAQHKLEHQAGYVIEMPFPTNREWLHSVPKMSKKVGLRISLTFRDIETKTCPKNP